MGRGDSALCVSADEIVSKSDSSFYMKINRLGLGIPAFILKVV